MGGFEPAGGDAWYQKGVGVLGELHPKVEPLAHFHHQVEVRADRLTPLEELHRGVARVDPDQQHPVLADLGGHLLRQSADRGGVGRRRL